MKFLKTLFALYGFVMAMMAVAGFVGIGEYRLFYGTAETLTAKVVQTCAALKRKGDQLVPSVKE